MARKDPRLSIRFKDHAELDGVEIWANRQGEKIIPWCYKAILRQAQAESLNDFLAVTAGHASIQSLALLREMAGPEAAQRAFDNSKAYIKKAQADVE